VAIDAGGLGRVIAQTGAPYSSGPPVLHDVRAAAAILKLTKGTLDKWRLKGTGPRYVQYGKVTALDDLELLGFVTPIRRIRRRHHRLLAAHRQMREAFEARKDTAVFLGEVTSARRIRSQPCG
jgi:hypothetical protein